MSNTQRENINVIFTIEKLDKLDDLAEALKNFTINYAKYYDSDTANASDAQGDTTQNTRTVTHTINWKVKVTDTSSGNFKQKLLSNRTLHVVVPTMNPIIDPRIIPIVAAPQTLLMPETKEVVVDAACSDAWVNRNLRRVSRTGIDGSTPGNVCNDVCVEHAPFLFLIGVVATSPPCSLIGSL